MIEVPDAEKSVGMEYYASTSSPCQARIKTEPEDFRVEETLAGLEVLEVPAPGLLPLYRVEKRSVDTIHLERDLADALKSRVSFAGLKDKRATAVQFATPTSMRSKRPERISGERYTAELVGFVPRPLSKGMVSGNRFQIVLRRCCGEIENRVDEVFALAKERRVANYYGLQRFGSGSMLTHRLGREMVKRRFSEAVRILLCEPRASDDETTKGARESMAKGDFASGRRLLPRGQDIERMVAARLEEREEDSIGALRAVPIRLRRLYVQAFQSYLFNRTLSRAISKGLDFSRTDPGDNWGEVSSDGLVLRKIHGVKEPKMAGGVPLVQLAGFIFRDYGSRFDGCLEEVMGEEGVSARDFFIEQMQEVSVEGGFRRPFLAASGLTREGLADGTCRLEFTLSRGEYATVLLREMVKPRDPSAQGFA